MAREEFIAIACVIAGVPPTITAIFSSVSSHMIMCVAAGLQEGATRRQCNASNRATVHFYREEGNPTSHRECTGFLQPAFLKIPIASLG